MDECRRADHTPMSSHAPGKLDHHLQTPGAIHERLNVVSELHASDDRAPSRSGPGSYRLVSESSHDIIVLSIGTLNGPARAAEN
ncbi:hypothetical protein GN244_ATG01726 [Phytophthora infestans]|uniref:Uncharacterized protein n=1 Tax=Phytophthora infestans TaxID=4787 RepID=A0A833TDR9_PHYIN|nr:hypothetical protein GN244_ATG01726 [Phytophthora infestans]KAF4133573.1 hypothetical protein GN958_ATG16910 [Phytophthora infestans]